MKSSIQRDLELREISKEGNSILCESVIYDCDNQFKTYSCSLAPNYSKTYDITTIPWGHKWKTDFETDLTEFQSRDVEIDNEENEDFQIIFDYLPKISFYQAAIVFLTGMDLRTT